MTVNQPPSNNAFDANLIKEAEPAEYSAVLNQLTANGLVGQSQLWPRGELVQPHKPSYFKPDTNLYRDTLKKDRRNGKELEYIHSAGTWLEQGLSALELFKTSPNAQTQGRLLHILEISLRASKEILAISMQYYRKGPLLQDNLPTSSKQRWRPHILKSHLITTQQCTNSSLLSTLLLPQRKSPEMKSPRKVVRLTRNELPCYPAQGLAKCPLGRNTAESRHMERNRSIPIRYPNDEIWNMGSTRSWFHEWENTRYFEAVVERSRVCSTRIRARMPIWYLRRDFETICKGESEGGSLRFSRICRLEKRQGKIYHQSENTINPLGQEICGHGDTERICLPAKTRRPHAIIRLERGLSPLPTAFKNMGLVHVSLQWAILSLYSTSIWLEKIAILVLSFANRIDTIHEVSIAMQGFTVDRRLPCCARERNLPQYLSGLRGNFLYLRRFIWKTGACASSKQRSLERWNYLIRTPRGRYRHGFLSLFCNTCKAYSTTANGVKIVADSAERKKVGERKSSQRIYWKGYFPVATNFAGTFLYKRFIQRFEEGPHPSRAVSGISYPLAQRQSERPTGLAMHAARRRKINRGWKARIESSHGRRGCGVWWNIRRRLSCGVGWGEACSAGMVPSVATQVYHCQGTARCQKSAPERSGEVQTFGIPRGTPSPRRQHGSLLHHQQHGVSQNRTDSRIESITQSSDRNENYPTGQVGSLRDQQTRRSPESNLEPPRPESDSFASAIARGITTVTISAAVLATWRSTSSPGESNTSTDGGVLGRRTGPTMEPAPAMDNQHNTENRGRESRGRDRGPSLDRGELVQAIAAHLPVASSLVSKRGTSVRLRIREPRMGLGNSRSRASPESALQTALSTRLPYTRAGEASRRLVSKAFAESTKLTKSSQWRKFVGFCESEGHLPLPAALGTVLAYVGFLFEEGTIGGSSVDHYVSAVRTCHQREGHPDPCYGTHLSDLIRASKREDENRGELKDVRAALSGSIVAKIRNYELAKPPGSIGERNAVMIEFQYLVGCREYTARSVQVHDIVLTRLQNNCIKFTARQRTWKCIPVRGIPLLS